METVYKTFGNKAGLLKAVFDVAVAGDDEPVPMVERDDIQRVIAEPEPARKLALYFDHFVDTMPRTAPVQLLVARRGRDERRRRMRSGSSCAASSSKR